MLFPICSSATALLLCAALSATAAVGQSLSIIKKGESNYWIEASAPASNPQTLRASANLHLWVDIHEKMPESYSFQVDDAGIFQRYFWLTSPAPPAPPISVVLIGDSMASDCCGWGRGIYGYFKPNATVINYAMPYASTKVFLQSVERDNMVLLQPDYVLVQYGFMDGHTDPERSTTLAQFTENLRTIVQMVRGFNGIPILITLHAHRTFDDKGKVVPYEQGRNDAIRQLAVELKTPLIDLYQLSTDLYNKLGPDGTAFMPWESAPNDVMHFSQLGGQYVSQLVVNALPDSFGPYLTAIFDPPPKP